MRRIGLLCVVVVSLCAAAAGGEGPVASVSLEPQGEGRGFVVTFAHPFRQGDIKEGLSLKAGDAVVPAQVNVKRLHPDGSVKHAILSVPLADAKPAKLDIYSVAASPAPGPALDGLPEGFQAALAVHFPDGTERRADAADFYRRAAAGAEGFRLTKWLEGPLVTEYQVAGPPVGEKGDPDPDLLVLLGLRVLRGGKAVRVEVVVENPWVDTPGNIPYDVRLTVGGKEVFAQEKVGLWRHEPPYWLKGKDPNLGHFAGARWRKVFWWGEAPPEVHVRYQPAYLAATKLLPPYDTGVAVPPGALARDLKRWDASPRGILENGIILGYFPTTGGREDIGPYPGWTARYLLSQDPRAAQSVLGSGDLAGSFPVHVRDRKGGRIFSIDEHPGFSLNRAGTVEQIPPRKAPDRPYVRPAASPYSVDCAHQPSLAFVPYLLTGDYYYLEEMYFWANWCMLIQNAGYRSRGKGLLHPDQMRGEAWALRQLVDAAKLAPESHPESLYFDDKVRSNLDWYTRFVASSDATPLGTYTVAATDAYVRGRAPAERNKWLTLPPWQQNFLAWSLDHAARAGYPQAAGPRDYLSGLQVGLLTHPGDYDLLHATPYFLIVGEREGGAVTWYTTWKELFEKTFRVVAPDTKPGIPDYGSSYAYIARAVLVLGVHNELPGAQDALKALDSHLPGNAKVLAEDPTWTFAP